MYPTNNSATYLPLVNNNYWREESKCENLFDKYSDEIKKYHFNNIVSKIFIDNCGKCLSNLDHNVTESDFVSKCFSLDMNYFNAKQVVDNDNLNFSGCKKVKDIKEFASPMLISKMPKVRHKTGIASVEAYNYLLNVLAEKPNAYKKCMNIINEMLESPFKPDEDSFNPIIKFVAKKNDEKGLLHLVNEMEKANVLPTVCYSALICLYIKQENPKKAMEVFVMMVNNEHKPNLLLCNYLIDFLLKQNHKYDANEVFKFMKKNGFRINPKPYASLISI